MKKILASILILSEMAVPAFAQGKHVKHYGGKSCPAATCTDHSYDKAYSAAQGSGVQNVEWVETTEKKNCPAATCTDHSYDKAYTGGWKVRSSAVTTRRVELPAAQPSEAWTPAPARLKDDAYSMSNYTIYGRTAPDPYHGDDAPSYDGAARNAYRNMRANNESAPLPPSTGEKR